MINKYRSDLQTESPNGIPYYKTAILTRIPEETVPFYYVTRQAERLDNISNKFYNSPSYWWVIAKANNIVGSIAVQEGTKLFIPNVL